MQVNNSIHLMIDRLQKDDERAMKSIYNFYYPRLFKFSHSFLKSDDAIEDILQEVFIRIWDKRHSIESTDSFQSFLFTITRNLLLNEIRDRMKNEELTDFILERSLVHNYEENSSKIDYDELIEVINATRQKFTKKQQTIYQLNRENGYSYNEIATKLGLSVKGVEYHMSQILSILREELKTSGVLTSTVLVYLTLF